MHRVRQLHARLWPTIVLVGISPAVAQTIVQLSIELSQITTRADLESGFSYALSPLQGRIVYQ